VSTEPFREEDFEPGEETLNIERSERSGMVLRVRFDPDETDAVLGRAEFEGLKVTEYAKRTILEHARMYTWTKTLPTAWNVTQAGGFGLGQSQ